jgi:hypothetical protein
VLWTGEGEVGQLYLDRAVLCCRDAVVLFRQKLLHNKFEQNWVKHEGSGKKEDIESWINKNLWIVGSNGLNGFVTEDIQDCLPM